MYAYIEALTNDTSSMSPLSYSLKLSIKPRPFKETNALNAMQNVEYIDELQTNDDMSFVKITRHSLLFLSFQEKSVI